MMPDEPLHMTLAEATIYLSDRDMTLACRGTSADFPKSRWTVIGHAYANTMGEGETWEEAVSAALGRPVMARDDTAELRAALAKMSDLVYTMLNAEDELSRVSATGGSYPDDVAGYHTARRNAWRDLQGLAQEYDDPAALAKWKERNK